MSHGLAWGLVFFPSKYWFLCITPIPLCWLTPLSLFLLTFSLVCLARPSLFINPRFFPFLCSCKLIGSHLSLPKYSSNPKNTSHQKRQKYREMFLLIPPFYRGCIGCWLGQQERIWFPRSLCKNTRISNHSPSSRSSETPGKNVLLKNASTFLAFFRLLNSPSLLAMIHNDELPP